MSTKIYHAQEQAGQGQNAAGAGGGGDGKQDDDVVDAEYKVHDDK